MPNPKTTIEDNLNYLKLPWIKDKYQEIAVAAGKNNWDYTLYLENLLEGETNRRRDQRTQWRIKEARFPILRTLQQFDWTWPKKINRQLIQGLAQLNFIEKKNNVIILGGVGLGKTHLATALGYQACLSGYKVLFSSVANMINCLSAAQAVQRLESELKKYIKPDLLIMDELGYLALDKHGADLLFQTISRRYQKGSIIITGNKAFKQWDTILNNDSTLTSALLDRALDDAAIVTIEGGSYRMKNSVDP